MHQLKLMRGSAVETMQIESSTGRPCRIRYSSPVTGVGEVADRDLFRCLIQIRESVEPLGWRILCNGSRRDAFATAMASDFNGGQWLTLLSLGRPHTVDDLVFIFDEALPHLVGSLEEQQQYKEAFFRGIR